MLSLERSIRRLIGRDWEQFNQPTPEAASVNKLSLGIYSPYCENVPHEITIAQKCVFEHLGLPLEQIEYGFEESNDKILHRKHGEVIEKIVRESNKDLLIFFDIDCIPLCQEVIASTYLSIMLSGALVGPAQRANHIDSYVYAAPSAIGFAKSIFHAVGEPNLAADNRHDTCGALSRACERVGIPVIRLAPSDFAVPKWPIYVESKSHCGHGTTYCGGIFHAFEMRLGSTREMFLTKCDDVLNTKKPEALPTLFEAYTPPIVSPISMVE